MAQLLNFNLRFVHHLWRVVSALKWGFADFDNLGVDADRLRSQTLVAAL